eukprot:Pgem_evm1s13461
MVTYYSAKSGVCISAVRAGVVDSVRGGCLYIKKTQLITVNNNNNNNTYVYHFKTVEKDTCEYCSYYNDVGGVMLFSLVALFALIVPSNQSYYYTMVT